jgi:hypothetical protein
MSVECFFPGLAIDYMVSTCSTKFIFRDEWSYIPNILTYPNIASGKLKFLHEPNSDHLKFTVCLIDVTAYEY